MCPGRTRDGSNQLDAIPRAGSNHHTSFWLLIPAWLHIPSIEQTGPQLRTIMPRCSPVESPRLHWRLLVGKQPSSEPNKKGSEQIIDLAIGQQPQIERLVVTSSSSYDHMGCIEMMFIVGPVRFLNPESWSTDCKVCINNESFALCDINRNMLSLSGP